LGGGGLGHRQSTPATGTCELVVAGGTTALVVVGVLVPGEVPVGAVDGETAVAAEAADNTAALNSLARSDAGTPLVLGLALGFALDAAAPRWVARAEVPAVAVRPVAVAADLPVGAVGIGVVAGGVLLVGAVAVGALPDGDGEVGALLDGDGEVGVTPVLLGVGVGSGVVIGATVGVGSSDTQVGNI
jgi:hypothetical protein